MSLRVVKEVVKALLKVMEVLKVGRVYRLSEAIRFSSAA